MHGVLQATRLASDVLEVQKHLREYDARKKRLGSALPEESALLAQRLSNINCACREVSHPAGRPPYPDGCPFRCCRQVVALKHALKVQRSRDRLCQWLALGTTRWRTIEQVEACALANKVCEKLLSPQSTSMPLFGLRAVTLALERLEQLWFVNSPHLVHLETQQLDQLADAIEARWMNVDGECLLADEGSEVLWARWRASGLPSRRRGWLRFVANDLPRQDRSPGDPPFLTPCERMVDNMIVRRIDARIEELGREYQNDQ